MRERPHRRATGGHQSALRIGASGRGANHLNDRSTASLQSAGADLERHERLARDRHGPALKAGHARGDEWAATESRTVIGRADRGDSVDDQVKRPDLRSRPGQRLTQLLRISGVRL